MTTIDLLKEAAGRLSRIESLCQQMRSLLKTITEIQDINEASDIRWYDNEDLRDAPLLGKTRNALLRSGKKVVGEVRRMSDAQLLEVRNIGPEGLKDIKRMLRIYNKEEKE